MFLKQKVFLIIFLLLSGCATISSTKPRHNLQPTALKEQPISQISQKKNHDFSNYQTFTILPSSILSGDSITPDNDVVQLHMLFILRNALEGRGYKFVKPSEEPDFIATIETSLEHKEDYITPKINSHSTWKLGDVASQILDTTLNSPVIWGEYQQIMASSLAHSNHMTLNKETPLGLSGGIYYPQISVTFFDGKNMSVVWHGQSVGASDNPVIQVSSQLIVRSITRQLALSKNRFKNFPTNSGRIGLGYAVITTDGKNYYPAVTGLQHKSPAEKTGLKNADYIIEINGYSTLNKSMARIASMLTGSESSILNLKIWRMGNSTKYSVKRIHR